MCPDQSFFVLLPHAVNTSKQASPTRKSSAADISGAAGAAHLLPVATQVGVCGPVRLKPSHCRQGPPPVHLFLSPHPISGSIALAIGNRHRHR
jgi:hypothetical protein